MSLVHVFLPTAVFGIFCIDWNPIRAQTLTFNRSRRADIEAIPTNYVWAVAATDDSKVFASTGAKVFSARDGIVKLWQDTGKEICTLIGHAGRVRCLAFSPDGTLLASCGEDASIRVWSTVTFQQTRLLNGHESGVNAIVFTPDGQRLFSGGDDGAVRVWDIANSRSEVSDKRHDKVLAVVASMNNRFFASSGFDGRVSIWDRFRSMEHRNLALRGSPVGHISFSPNSKLLASSSAADVVTVWDVGSGQPVASLGGNTGPIEKVAFDQSGSRLAVAGAVGSIKMWDTANWVVCLEVQRGVHAIIDVWFTKDGEQLVSVNQNGVVEWDSVPR